MYVLAVPCPNAIPLGELGLHSCFGYFVVDDIDDYHGVVISNGARKARLAAVNSLRLMPS